jgi:hypothetical protein
MSKNNCVKCHGNLRFSFDPDGFLRSYLYCEDCGTQESRIDNIKRNIEFPCRADAPTENEGDGEHILQQPKA